MIRIKLLLAAIFLAFATIVYAEYKEVKVIDQITVLEDGQIQIRQATKIYKDGVEIGKTYHRHVIAPDLTDLTSEDTRVKAVANVLWTPAVKKAYEDQKKANEEKGVN